MKSSTNTLIDAMKILASEIQSQDGVANAAILEASERLNELMDKVAELEQYLDNVKTLSIYVAFHDSAQSVSIKQAREWLDSFKLEQQANILELVRKHNVRQKRKFGSRWGSGHIIDNLQIEERNLREQAKQLKGGAE